MVYYCLLLLFFACDEKQFFSEYKELDGTWKKSDTLRFTFEQKDTVNPYHLFLNVRNNNDYPFNNMYLIVTLKEPGKKPTIKIDTLGISNGRCRRNSFRRRFYRCKRK